MDLECDDSLRVTKVSNQHLTADQDDYPELGTWDYAYDSAGNVLTADQADMDTLDGDRSYGYDP